MCLGGCVCSGFVCLFVSLSACLFACLFVCLVLACMLVYAGVVGGTGLLVHCHKTKRI